MENQQPETHFIVASFGKLIAFIRFLKRIRLKISISIILGMLLGIIYSKFIQKPLYVANQSFTLEQKSSSGGSLGGLASSLGLGDLASASSGSGLFGGENILFLLKSNRIIHKSLKESLTELKGDNLLNLYIKAHYKKSLDNGKIQYLPKNLEKFNFSRRQDSLLLLVTKNIRKYQLQTERLDKKTTIITLDVNDINEQWAYLFSKALVKNAIELYLDIKVGKLLRTEQELTNKKDSIRGLLDGSITTLAFETDMNSHTPLMRYKTKQAKKQIDVEVLKSMYASVIQNLEMTKFQRSQEEPIIEIIDEPIYPLEVEKIGTIKGAIIGAIIFSLITLLIFSMKEVLKNSKF